MTRTDGILAALQQELERRRSELDATMGLATISIIVELNGRTGEPRNVICRTESRVVVDRNLVNLIE